MRVYAMRAVIVMHIAQTFEPGQNDTFLMRARTEMQPCRNDWPAPKWYLGFVENIEAVKSASILGSTNMGG
jgi:hypothetical protein